MRRGGSKRRRDTIAANKLSNATVHAASHGSAPHRRRVVRAALAGSRLCNKTTRSKYIRIYNVNLGAELIDYCVVYRFSLC